MNDSKLPVRQIVWIHADPISIPICRPRSHRLHLEALHLDPCRCQQQTPSDHLESSQSARSCAAVASASVRYFWRQKRSQESKEAEGVPSPSPSFSSSFALSPFSSRKSVKTLPEQSVSGSMAIHGDQIIPNPNDAVKSGVSIMKHTKRKISSLSATSIHIPIIQRIQGIQGRQGLWRNLGGGQHGFHCTQQDGLRQLQGPQDATCRVLMESRAGMCIAKFAKFAKQQMKHEEKKVSLLGIQGLSKPGCKLISIVSFLSKFKLASGHHLPLRISLLDEGCQWGQDWRCR